MNQRSRITGQPAPTTTTPDIDESLRRTVADPTVRPRRLFAAGMKRGNGPLVIQAVAA